jgi:outer membrane protein insertion porin family
LRTEPSISPRILLSFLAFFLASPALAQGLAPGGDPYSGRKIRNIRLDPEIQPIPANEIDELILIKAGDSYDLAKIRLAMSRLYRSGHFENVEVDAQRAGEEVDLTFRTEAALFIGGVDVDGAPGAVPRGELINAAKLPLGQPFDESLAKQAVESIEQELRLDGFYGSNVKYALQRDTLHSQVNIFFFVEPGPRARFSQPIFKGTLLFPEPKLTATTKWRRPFYLPGWRYLSEARIQSGIRNLRNLYAKQDYLMSKIQLERLELRDGNLVAVPHVRIDPGPKVELELEGAKLGRKQIRRLVPVYEEQSVDKDLLIEGSRKLAAEFRSRGYFENTVNYQVLQDGAAVDEIDPAKNTSILYQIDLGERFKVTKVSLRGYSYFDELTLRERMAIQPATLLRYRRGRFSDALLEGDKAAILDLYRGNGFLDAKVSSEVTQTQQGKDRNVEVLIAIEENEQSLIDEVRIEGVAESDREFLRPYISAAPGQPFSNLTLNTDRERVLGLLYQNGYASAGFESRVERDPVTKGVDITYTIVGGKQNFLREVIITGLKTTSSALVNKRITLEADQPLNNAHILTAQRKLYDLGIFARVDTALQNPEGEEVKKTVLFNLEEASRWSFNGGIGAEIARIGGGVTSLDAPAGGAGFSPRVSFGVNRSNFWGVGHTVGVQTRLSNIQRRVLLTYLAPQFRDSDRYALTFTALYDDSRNVRTFNSKRAEGALQLSQRIDISQSIQYRFTYRDIRIPEETIKIDPSLIPILAQPVRTGSFSSTFIQDRRDDPVDAKRGRYTTVDFGVASHAFASSSNFLRLLARNATYYRLKRDIVLARNTQFGLLSPYGSTAREDPATNVPLPERFFSGGANSHRGFPENQAGPRDLITGFPLGGKATLMNSVELRFPLIGDNIGGVFFHDAGNVYSGASNISFRWRQRDLRDFDYMVHAFGFGLRYRTPIGPVRIDLALSPNSARFNGYEGTLQDLLNQRGRTTQLRVNQFQFHISLGQAF